MPKVARLLTVVKVDPTMPDAPSYHIPYKKLADIAPLTSAADMAKILRQFTPKGLAGRAKREHRN